ncbi:T9SS type A sorting domain-containing protein [Flavobacterium sp. LMO8]|jgi:hypothetical protein|uniref:T9SS type A sorting domain-containing protein n=1 Tax=Flavobacterium sp. LMO8 TaxID=2654244 RepID=UPI001291E3D2|nr:T9SS type A sorting domain-containing protein [Flavobacterium sp. LMO8]MQP24412.1 T9SS type A sorting domain-containing protein [Flavobacterium sp. LMO8]
MKHILILTLILISIKGFSQVVLNADGPGNTYSLINSVLAPGYNVIEAPDCSHTAFGEHIDEIFDAELNSNVFRFFIHTTPDNDRCINFDRQRNEIKTYDQSPANLLGIQNETVIYKWKFKLKTGFQSSTNFTHIHQLKSVGGSLEDMPMYTLTTRKGTPDKLELRYAETNTQTTLTQTDIAPFLGTWVEVTETIKYGTAGTYSIVIKKVSDMSTLFSYSNNSIINWRSGADFVRPKWGIYRSLNNAQDLRDEEVLFANFSIQEIPTLSIEEVNENEENLTYYLNKTNQTLHLKNAKNSFKNVKLYSSDGKLVSVKSFEKEVNEYDLDISNFQNGVYIFLIEYSNYKRSSKKFLVSK